MKLDVFWEQSECSSSVAARRRGFTRTMLVLARACALAPRYHPNNEPASLPGLACLGRARARERESYSPTHKSHASSTGRALSEADPSRKIQAAHLAAFTTTKHAMQQHPSTLRLRYSPGRAEDFPATTGSGSCCAALLHTTAARTRADLLFPLHYCPAEISQPRPPVIDLRANITTREGRWNNAGDLRDRRRSNGRGADIVLRAGSAAARAPQDDHDRTQMSWRAHQSWRRGSYRPLDIYAHVCSMQARVAEFSQGGNAETARSLRLVTRKHAAAFQHGARFGRAAGNLPGIGELLR